MAIADRIVHSRKKKTPEQTTAQNLPQIWDASSNLVASTTTDSKGNYSFKLLVPGDYFVKVECPQGYLLSPMKQGDNEELDSDGDENGWSETITILCGDEIGHVDFGFTEIVLAAIGDRVWLDQNGDGIQDAGEDGIPNVKVELYDSTGTILIAVARTDTGGNYLFKDIVPGSYSVVVDDKSLPAGLAANPTYDDDGTGSSHTSAVEVGESDIYLQADFGYNWAPPADTTTGTGAIGDRVWIDVNGDGKQDADEPGLADVTVTLYDDHDGDGVYDNPVATTTTDANGNYIFYDIPVGSYVVAVNGGQDIPNYTQTGDPDYFGEKMPAGKSDNKTTSPIIIAPGEVFLNADFGYKPDSADIGSIGRKVWLDLDGNGIYDDGEPGISGITVVLKNISGDIIAKATTDKNGEYSFAGLPVNTEYTVEVTDVNNILDGFVQSFDADGLTTPDSSTVTNLQPGAVLSHDFGYTLKDQVDNEGNPRAKGVIGNSIWLDRNGNGIQDEGELGIQGVIVELYDYENELIATTTTDVNGNYYFGGIDDGEYTVRVNVDTLPNSGNGITNTFYADGNTANQSSVEINDGSIKLDQNFGYKADTPNTVGGTIWEDTNADGLLTDGSENTSDETPNGIAGVTVTLQDKNGNILDKVRTDASGNFVFSDLPDGEYYVYVTDEENKLRGWWKTYGEDQTADHNSKANGYKVVVASGNRIDMSADFGYWYHPAALGNRVWNDANNNGIQDEGEEGIEGVTVILTIVYPGESAVTSTVAAVTDENGYYKFDNIFLKDSHEGTAARPTYIISVRHPPYLQPSDVNQGSDESVDSDEHDGVVAAVNQGEYNDTYDFGYYYAPTLSVIISFEAFTSDGEVFASWTTLAEYDTLGYWIERKLPDGKWIRINPNSPVWSDLSGGMAVYELADSGASPGGTYTWRVIEIEGTGVENIYGPYTVTVDGDAADYDSWAAGIEWGGKASGRDDDPDGDGLSNFEEFLAGTDPLKADSLLRITYFKPVDNGIEIRWDSVPGKVYSIEHAKSLNSLWLPIKTGIAADDTVTSFIVPGADGGFFRIVLHAE
jgi:serine-aspartate repeat-containing protein C/D/E